MKYLSHTFCSTALLKSWYFREREVSEDTGGIPKPKSLWAILYESLAFKICHMYKVLVSLANYCCIFSISAGLRPYSRHMVLI